MFDHIDDCLRAQPSMHAVYGISPIARGPVGFSEDMLPNDAKEFRQKFGSVKLFRRPQWESSFWVGIFDQTSWSPEGDGFHLLRVAYYLAGGCVYYKWDSKAQSVRPEIIGVRGSGLGVVADSLESWTRTAFEKTRRAVKAKAWKELYRMRPRI